MPKNILYNKKFHLRGSHRPSSKSLLKKKVLKDHFRLTELETLGVALGVGNFYKTLDEL